MLLTACCCRWSAIRISNSNGPASTANSLVCLADIVLLCMGCAVYGLLIAVAGVAACHQAGGGLPQGGADAAGPEAGARVHGNSHLSSRACQHICSSTGCNTSLTSSLCSAACCAPVITWPTGSNSIAALVQAVDMAWPDLLALHLQQKCHHMTQGVPYALFMECALCPVAWQQSCRDMLHVLPTCSPCRHWT